jgi:hypothetical protein
VNLKISKRDYSPILVRSPSKFIQVSKPRGDQTRSKNGNSGTTDEDTRRQPQMNLTQRAAKQINSAVTRGPGAGLSNYNSQAISQEAFVEQFEGRTANSLFKASPERRNRQYNGGDSPKVG